MISTCDFYLLIFTSKIIQLNTFLEFFSCSHVTSKSSILSNHAKHPKGLVLLYALSLFTILKSLYPIGQPACLEKDNFS